MPMTTHTKSPAMGRKTLRLSFHNSSGAPKFHIPLHRLIQAGAAIPEETDVEFVFRNTGGSPSFIINNEDDDTVHTGEEPVGKVNLHPSAKKKSVEVESVDEGSSEEDEDDTDETELSVIKKPHINEPASSGQKRKRTAETNHGVEKNPKRTKVGTKPKLRKLQDAAVIEGEQSVKDKCDRCRSHASRPLCKLLEGKPKCQNCVKAKKGCTWEGVKRTGGRSAAGVRRKVARTMASEVDREDYRMTDFRGVGSFVGTAPRASGSGTQELSRTKIAQQGSKGKMRMAELPTELQEGSTTQWEEQIEAQIEALEAQLAGRRLSLKFGGAAPKRPAKAERST